MSASKIYISPQNIKILTKLLGIRSFVNLAPELSVVFSKREAYVMKAFFLT